MHLAGIAIWRDLSPEDPGEVLPCISYISVWSETGYFCVFCSGIGHNF